MDLELSDEQVFLRDAARDALSRTNTVEAAHGALDGGEMPDLWGPASEAGWPGLLISEASGGAGLGAFDAMLVAQEVGRVLAAVPLLGHVPATELLDRAGHDRLEALAAGELRACLVAAEPPGDLDPSWTVEPAAGMQRAAAPTVDEDGTLRGDVHWVPDAPGAGLLVVVATAADGGVRAVAVESDADGVTVEDVRRYDVTRPLGHVRLDGARGTVLDVDEHAVARAWHLTQALIAAEAVGASETCLEMALAYAKERFTFGRPIGSYQAIKHGLTEMLRRTENARSLLYYAGWAHESRPEEFALAANAARTAGGEAIEFCARQNIVTHGGIGATWEHDAPLFFRRAELTRRLLGGTSGAADRVAGELLGSAASP